MKLLELIVKNVKREDIPSNAKWFVNDKDGEVKSSESENKPKMDDCGVWMRDIGFNGLSKYIGLSSDWRNSVVTREELMQAYDLVEQGYTLWFGGECPVSFDAEVVVVFSIGLKRGGSLASTYDWLYEGSGTDIIAYKLVEQPTTKEKLSLPTYYCEEKLQDTTLDVWTSQSGDLCVNITSLGVNNEIVMSPITALQFANELSVLALKLMEKEND